MSHKSPVKPKEQLQIGPSLPIKTQLPPFEHGKVQAETFTNMPEPLMKLSCSTTEKHIRFQCFRKIYFIYGIKQRLIIPCGY